jgi:SNF2 family DNA or RNA helicase
VALNRCRECSHDETRPQSSCHRCEKELNEINWTSVIADEAHKLKGPMSQWTRAAWWLARGAAYRFALTGTPIANSLDDLWSVLHFLDATAWPSRVKFIERYASVSWNPWGGLDVIGIKPQTRTEFFKAFDPIFLRRPKQAVLAHLPPKVYERRYCTMVAKQKKAYKQMADQQIAELETGTLAATTGLTKALRQSQFAAAYAELLETGTVQLTEPSCKLDTLMEVLEEAGDQQVVVFAESAQLLRLAATRLEKEKISYGRVMGDNVGISRDRDIEEFQMGRLRVLLVTIKAGGEGLTLLAPIAVFLQRPFSVLESKQAEDRLHRPGAEQFEAVTFIDIVTEETLEEVRFDVLADKEEKLQEIVRDTELLKMFLKGKS